jgi:hypothetical protein
MSTGLNKWKLSHAKAAVTSVGDQMARVLEAWAGGVFGIACDFEFASVGEAVTAACALK